LASAGNSKILFDPSPELELEGVIVPEFQASCRFWSSNGWPARRAHVELLSVCRNAPPSLPNTGHGHSSATETL